MWHGRTWQGRTCSGSAVGAKVSVAGSYVLGLSYSEGATVRVTASRGLCMVRVSVWGRFSISVSILGLRFPHGRLGLAAAVQVRLGWATTRLNRRQMEIEFRLCVKCMFTPALVASGTS